MSENSGVKLPEVVVFAGPNGSGKFKKRKDICFRWNNQFWDNNDIEKYRS